MNYYTYKQCKEYLKSFNIKSSYQFYSMIKLGSFNDNVNKRPYEHYRTIKRNDWISWEDFLSFSKIQLKKEKYLPFIEAREYIRKLNIKNQKEWCKWCIENDAISIKIPTNPNIIYKKDGWVSLSDWLGTKSYKNKTKIDYLNYIDCKNYIKNNFHEIKNRSVWHKMDRERLPLFIPKRPDYMYKKTGEWVNWEDFLDSDISPRSKSKLFLSFEESKKYVQDLKFKDQYEFVNYLENNNINFIPKRPSATYKKEWKGFLDFLGCDGNRTSIGERLIKAYLDDNKIKYEKEKYFDTCKNINKLPFDFYLPEYKICIEYDGELHYKSNDKFGGIERLNRSKKHDKIKTKWCKENDIKLLRIKYLKKNKISKILSNFLL